GCTQRCNRHLRDAAGQLHRLGHEVVGCDRPQCESALDRFVGGDPVAGVELERGALVAHHDRHQQAARCFGHATQGNERRTKSGPAENARPLPVSTTHATSLLASASSKAVPARWYISSLNAFNASGRLNVMTRTRASSNVSRLPMF